MPDDAAIVGFDDIPAAAGALIPLATVRVDVEALGRAGVDLLVRGDATEQHMTLPAGLWSLAAVAGPSLRHFGGLARAGQHRNTAQGRAVLTIHE